MSDGDTGSSSAEMAHAEALETQGRYHAAAEQWLTRAADADTQSDQTEALLARLRASRCWSSAGRHLAAMGEAQRAAADARGDRFLEAMALHGIGTAWLWRAEPEQARAAIGEAARAFGELDDGLGLIACRLTLAECFVAEGSWDHARETMGPLQPNDALSVGPEELARYVAVRASIAASEGDSEQAFEQWRRAQDILEDLGDPAQVARSESLLAIGFTAGRNRAVAAGAYREVVDRYAAVDNQHDRARAAYALAGLLLQDAQLLEADQACNTAIEACSQAGDVVALKTALERAVDVAMALKHPWLAIDRFRALAAACAELGDVQGRLGALVSALESMLHVDGDDTEALADELIDELPHIDLRHIDHSWVRRAATLLAQAERAEAGVELAETKARAETSAGRYSIAGELFAAAADAAAAMGDPDRGAALFGEALAATQGLRHRERNGWLQRQRSLQGGSSDA